ncbi:MAG: alanine--tRNA ligase [Chitinophagaceae bacterium]
MTSNEIRKQFLDFFKSKAHVIVPSSSIVVKNDPTLMFTNAGMNQFKDYFLGNRKSPNPRVADTQKCLRVSGKHNDLEEVGVDTYHHTMFEMLGNWSFGDYFKKEAIAWSWELLTEVFKIDKDRLYVTIFEGDATEGLPRDEEAYNEWKKVIAEDRILLGNKKDNFWEMGETGPCGPCTEIHVDCRSAEERKATDGKTLVNNDHPQVIEIWNNVFIQFNRLKNGSLEHLPEKHVDTGMGFERLVRVLQQKTSNYDTDVFSGTINTVEEITGKKYDNSDSRQAVAFRVLADHIRAISFTIADGQLPSNTGAGYVIRRILRRAVRYYYSYLDFKQPLLHQLVMQLSLQFKYVFPELYEQAEFVSKVIREEEESFLRTLEKGLKRIDDLVKSAKDGRLGGAETFELYDTYGFPIDLTRLIALENNLQVDEAGFEKALKEQKDRSRAATAVDTDDWIELGDSGKTSFTGYRELEAETRVARYRKIRAKGKEQYQLVLDSTPFYAESGGQVGDTGQLEFPSGPVRVNDTKKENDLIIHFTDELPAEINSTVIARVDKSSRAAITRNHTATHLLHAALKVVLGKQVAQKGSLVSANVLRFDFAHFSKMTDEEIRRVEEIVNEKVRENIPVVIREMPKEEALKSGATALFGEKYGDLVRVVTIDPDYSVELCGGTHVGATGMIGLFSITSESAVAAGVRRIEALTGEAAINHYLSSTAQLKKLTELLKTKEPLKSVEKLMDDKHALEKKLESAEARQLLVIRDELVSKTEKINGIDFVGAILDLNSADGLRKIGSELKNKLDNYAAVLCAGIDGKSFVAISLSDKLTAAGTLDAGKMIKEIVAPLIKGGGGGQKNQATAGGQDSSRLQEVIDAVRKVVAAQ